MGDFYCHQFTSISPLSYSSTEKLTKFRKYLNFYVFTKKWLSLAPTLHGFKSSGANSQKLSIFCFSRLVKKPQIQKHNWQIAGIAAKQICVPYNTDKNREILVEKVIDAAQKNMQKHKQSAMN